MTMAMTDADLQATVATSEFDSWMQLQVLSLQPETLSMRMPLRAEMIGAPKLNRLHGGLVASLIDAVGCYLLIARLGTRVSTANLVIDYLRPPQGDLVAEAQLVKLGRRLCNVTVSVRGADGKVAATGRLSVVPLSMSVGEEDPAALSA